ncbi:MAG: nucleoside triphosphate pyrophosphohydrolase [Clostridia bacterium]|nr:nucleoside triphosphate pyrophosphohydrolase [Clostridia bacterium]
MKKDRYDFYDLLKIIEKLRSDDGCPWDREQTHQSLKKYMIEESYEALEAIDLQNDSKLKEELGDVLLQIVLHSQIAKEENSFDINDVIHVVSEKMVYRHAHVFGDVIANTPEEVLISWNKLKNKEKGFEKASHILEDVPKNLPGLMRSSQLQDKASKVGFDWDDKSGAVLKVREEIEELLETIDTMNKDEQESEMGDVLFSLVNVCRFLKIDPETAITRTNNKFIKRFELMEDICLKRNLQMELMTLDQLDEIWEEAKHEIG